MAEEKSYLYDVDDTKLRKAMEEAEENLAKFKGRKFVTGNKIADVIKIKTIEIVG